MTKRLQMIKITITADIIDGKVVNGRTKAEGSTLDIIVDLVRSALNELEKELDVQRNKLCNLT